MNMMKDEAVALREEADFLESQGEIAEAALKSKGDTAKHYSAEFQILGSKRVGTFVGLACKSCRRWEECGHTEDCPVAELEGLKQEDCAECGEPIEP